jgi:hypothetical protein
MQDFISHKDQPHSKPVTDNEILRKDGAEGRT